MRGDKLYFWGLRLVILSLIKIQRVQVFNLLKSYVKDFVEKYQPNTKYTVNV